MSGFPIWVPRDPDEARLRAGVDLALRVSLGGDYHWFDYMRDLWRVMVVEPSEAALTCGSGRPGPDVLGGVTALTRALSILALEYQRRSAVGEAALRYNVADLERGRHEGLRLGLSALDELASVLGEVTAEGSPDREASARAAPGQVWYPGPIATRSAETKELESWEAAFQDLLAAARRRTDDALELELELWSILMTLRWRLGLER